MIKSTNTKFSRSLLLLIFFALFCCLVACGGSKDTTATDTGGGTTTDQSSVTLTLSSSTVSYAIPVTATATVIDANGALVPNAVVTFTATDTTLVAFTPTSGTVLTNASGVASITLNAASIDSAGVTSITASAPVTTSGTTTTLASSPVGISVGGASVTLGAITLGFSSISSYGSSSVSVPVLIDGSPATVSISVNFTSSCVSAGKATLISPVSTIAGTATSTYTDNNCNSGTDTITASITGGATVSTTITVIPPATSNIQFVSATPETIATQTVGSATLPKSSLVKFKVVDNNNQGKSGVAVDFSLITTILVGGLSLTPLSATSDTDGYVTTSVTSGTVPTPVWVVATVHGSSPVISSQSNMLTITTGLPAQNAFSLSVSTFNIEGLSYDGVTSTLTITASDRLGNSVPDGTGISFITPEGAQILPASCITKNGTCTVTFKSANPRPADGRVTVLAYAVGEMSFVDANGNNSYDAGETFYDLGNLYVDYNENGKWDTGEQYFAPYASAGTSACLTQPSGDPLPYGRDVSNKENTCNGTWGINYVRRSTVIVLSGSTAQVSPNSFPTTGQCFGVYNFMLMDVNNNPMPAGTTVAINSALSNTNYTYRTTQGDPPQLVTVAVPATLGVAGTPVGNTPQVGGTGVSLIINGGPGCIAAETVGYGCAGSGCLISYPVGPVAIDVKTPKGNTTTISISIY